MKKGLSAASAAAIMEDPLFRLGHDEVWQGRDLKIRGEWSRIEELTYRSGRGFAEWLQRQGEPRERFSKGGVINAELAALIVHWRARALSGVIA